MNELKGELEARGQSSKGLKSQLQARLQKLLQVTEPGPVGLYVTEPGLVELYVTEPGSVGL